MFGKKNVNKVGIDIQKNAIRYCLIKGGKYRYGEEVVNGSIFKDDHLRNSEEFSSILRKIAATLKISNPDYIFAARNSKLLIRQIPVNNMKSAKEIKEYLFFELGESISLPFDTPIFDILIPEENKKKNKPKGSKSKKREKDSKREVRFYKASKEKISEAGHVSVVVTSEPILEEIGDAVLASKGDFLAVDCSVLALARVFDKRINWGETFLIIEIDGGVASFTFFDQFVPVYAQYEDYNSVNWRYSEKKGKVVADYKQAVEHESIQKLAVITKNVIDFFESEKEQKRTVSQIYLIGGHPELSKSVVKIMEETNRVSVKALKSPLMVDDKKRLPDKFSLAAGLAMKEV